MIPVGVLDILILPRMMIIFTTTEIVSFMLSHVRNFTIQISLVWLSTGDI